MTDPKLRTLELLNERMAPSTLTSGTVGASAAFLTGRDARTPSVADPVVVAGPRQTVESAPERSYGTRPK